MIDFKTCVRCDLPKTSTDFYKDKRATDGLYSHCKDCHNFHLRTRYSENVDAERARRAKYRLENLGKFSGYTRRYKASKADQVGYLPDGWFDAMVRTYGLKCAQCGSNDRIEVDHVVPLANGGLDEIANLQFLCKPHNAGKRNHRDTDYRSVILVDTLKG